MKVAMFFDGKNFYEAKRKYAPALNVHYETMAQWVADQVGGSGAEFVGAYYYTGYSTDTSPKGIGVRNFLMNLEMRRGFFVKREPRVRRTAKCKRCGKTYTYRTEKRVDTRLVADLIHFAAVNAYDAAVVFSGDQDLIPAIEAVNAMGKRVYLATWPKHGVSRDLRIAAFGQVYLRDGEAIFKVVPGMRAGAITAPTPAPAAVPPSTVVVTVTPPAAVAAPAPPTAVVATAPAPAHAAPIPSVENEVDAAAKTLTYVSLGYFITRWQGQPGFPPVKSRERIEAVNKAISEGRVVSYDHSQGSGTVRALRLP